MDYIYTTCIKEVKKCIRMYLELDEKLINRIWPNNFNMLIKWKTSKNSYHFYNDLEIIDQYKLSVVFNLSYQELCRVNIFFQTIYSTCNVPDPIKFMTNLGNRKRKNIIYWTNVYNNTLRCRECAYIAPLIHWSDVYNTPPENIHPENIHQHNIFDL